MQVASIEEKLAVEAEMGFDQRVKANTLFEFVSDTTDKYPNKNALTFQLKSGPKDPAETFTWSELRAFSAQAANLFRGLGVEETDVVAYILPNCNEAVLTFIGGATAGIVNPINPLLSPEQIASILRETNAKVVVTLAPFPKADVAQKAAAAVALAPNVKHVLEVDLKRYLKPPLAWLIPLLRPKVSITHSAKVQNFNAALDTQNKTLDWAPKSEDRIAAYFHTGGTTGMPKVAQHTYSGMIYNGWCAEFQIFTPDDVLICPLPMFHVFAAYPILMACIASGAHMMMPTPQGYRGDGVFDNFWKLIERYQATFMVTVPTAVAALMQRAIDADVSTLKYALCGSAPLPVELFKKFEEATGVRVLEGYGMTEATCLISINPIAGNRKMGSVGLPFPYSDVKILDCEPNGTIKSERMVDEIGEICVNNPGVVVGSTYVEEDKNVGLFADGKYMRTGDLGRIDGDGFVWITGRAKDLIIRGGHNIDPAVIEDALASHPDVAMSGAIGQVDIHSGEVPCVYVELIDGGTADTGALMAHLKENVKERAAVPKYVEIVDELPKTAVGKILKNELRRSAIKRVFSAALEKAGLEASVSEVIEHKKRGLIAEITAADDVTDEAITEVLGMFSRPWERAQKP
ncbi:MAG: acyl-CoA synthetase [Rhodobacteraceae bacterium]|nr:acyl-CoA synthetase [Paracoccaceae bacterium]